MKDRQVMPDVGLCSAAKYNTLDENIFSLVKPTVYDLHMLEKEGKNATWWGSDKGAADYYSFTTLRQTIVLLMAAINNEL